MTKTYIPIISLWSLHQRWLHFAWYKNDKKWCVWYSSVNEANTWQHQNQATIYLKYLHCKNKCDFYWYPWTLIYIIIVHLFSMLIFTCYSFYHKINMWFEFNKFVWNSMYVECWISIFIYLSNEKKTHWCEGSWPTVKEIHHPVWE